MPLTADYKTSEASPTSCSREVVKPTFTTNHEIPSSLQQYYFTSKDVPPASFSKSDIGKAIHLIQIIIKSLVNVDNIQRIYMLKEAVNSYLIWIVVDSVTGEIEDKVFDKTYDLSNLFFDSILFDFFIISVSEESNVDNSAAVKIYSKT